MWLHATLTDDLLDMVMDDDITAHGVWTKIGAFFLGNKSSRAVQLEQELHNLSQGDMSADAYCHRLKTLADALADCDQPVRDRALVHQLIRGLNPKYHVLRQLLPAMPSFPTFMEARDQLIVTENTLASSPAPTQETTLTNTDTTNASTNAPTPRQAPDRGSSYSSPRGHGGPRGRGRGRGGRGTVNGRGQNGHPAWMHQIPPWVASWLTSASAWRSPWTGATGPGVLGSRPPVGQAYNAGFVQPTTQLAPPAAPSFDMTGLLQALQAAALPQTSSQQEWYMDTGASAHISGDAGSSQQESGYEVQ
ncbi:uncharacterized protein LOC133904649 [Phragmites australis]|uniref:uncharacterized protein LOC133904649 n=1 Tax=Phragmites australis TaxID=29695 RepID=UPI002D788899|nr:uncharacterized protein LOC133904649 [Phragmites australis]